MLRGSGEVTAVYSPKRSVCSSAAPSAPPDSPKASAAALAELPMARKSMRKQSTSTERCASAASASTACAFSSKRRQHSLMFSKPRTPSFCSARAAPYQAYSMGRRPFMSTARRQPPPAGPVPSSVAIRWGSELRAARWSSVEPSPCVSVTPPSAPRCSSDCTRSDVSCRRPRRADRWPDRAPAGRSAAAAAARRSPPPAPRARG